MTPMNHHLSTVDGGRCPGDLDMVCLLEVAMLQVWFQCGGEEVAEASGDGAL